MTTFTVTNKQTSAVVYRYASDAPVEWAGMGFDTHDHTPDAVPDIDITDVVPTAMIWTKLEYLRRFTQAERIAIRTTTKTVPMLEDYMALLELASEVRSDDPDVIAALNMLEAGGLIGTGRAQEILNGN